MRRLLLVVLAVAVTVGLAGAPASAQTKVRQDKVGDAPANLDIRSAKVQNNTRNFAVTVRFQKVQHRNTTLFSVFVPGTPARVEEDAPYFVLTSTPKSHGRYSTRLLRFDDAGDEDEPVVPCPGLAARWKSGTRGFARVVIPQSCFGDAAGTLTTIVASQDKQAPYARMDLSQARRGDAEPVPGDAVDSFITTRRG